MSNNVLIKEFLEPEFGKDIIVNENKLKTAEDKF